VRGERVFAPGVQFSSRGSPARTIADLRGFAAESVCAVLREQGCQIIARTYRAWLSGSRPAARIHGDALVIDARRATIWQPDSLYGRRKMAARLRRRGWSLTVTEGGRVVGLASKPLDLADLEEGPDVLLVTGAPVLARHRGAHNAGPAHAIHA